MRYWYRAPHERLADYVRTVLVADVLAEDNPTKVPLVIAGMPGVVVQWSACNIPGNGLHAAHPEIDITLFGAPIPAGFKLSDRHAITVAYFFKPFTLSTVFDISAPTLTKSPIALEHWSKSEALALKARLHHVETVDKIIDELDAFVIGLVARHYHTCELIRISTDAIMVDPRVDLLSQLPDRLHTTLRTFQRMFKRYVGVSPTQYRRICQFQQSFQQVRMRQFDKLSDVAADNGFADQSHFVRSFREFSRTTPGKYLDEGLQ